MLPQKKGFTCSEVKQLVGHTPNKKEVQHIFFPNHVWLLQTALDHPLGGRTYMFEGGAIKQDGFLMAATTAGRLQGIVKKRS